ncbi:MAG: hypothetical protein AAGA17_09915 [Actinomycetota bacterium]
MSRLSDVLGGVYRDDDPAPNQHDSTALTDAPETDAGADEAPVWEIDADDDPVAEMERPGDPSAEAPVWDLGSVVDDPESDWETEESFEIESEWAETAQPAVDRTPAPADSDWLDGLADDTDDGATWDPESIGAESFDEVEVVTDKIDSAPAEEPTTDEAATVEAVVGADDDRGVTAASFGLLGEDEPAEPDLLDGGPWLRTDDDILPERTRRGLAFWRR